MAFYKQDIVDVNLETGVIHRSFLNHTIGHKDDDADRFGIRAFRNGEPVDLSGAQCQAVFMAPDGTNIALTSYGTVSGNEAYVTLPQACYNVEGQFCLAIKLVGGGVTATVRIIDGVVDRTGATGAVAPTEAVPTYQEILAVYAEMQEDVADYESVVATQNGKIDDLKSAINFITGNNPTWTEGKYIKTDGTIVDSPSYNITSKIPVIGGSKIRIRTRIGGNAAIAFYDKDNNVVGGVSAESGDLHNYDIIAPVLAASFIASCYAESARGFEFETDTVYAGNKLKNELLSTTKGLIFRNCDEIQNVGQYNTNIKDFFYHTNYRTVLVKNNGIFAIKISCNSQQACPPIVFFSGFPSPSTFLGWYGNKVSGQAYNDEVILIPENVEYFAVNNYINGSAPFKIQIISNKEIAEGELYNYTIVPGGGYSASTKDYFANDNYKYVLLTCEEGDIFVITTVTNGSNHLALAYTGTPSASTFITDFVKNGDNMTVYKNAVIIAPKGCTKLAINGFKTNDLIIKKIAYKNIELYKPPVYAIISEDSITVEPNRAYDGKTIKVIFKKRGGNNLPDFDSVYAIADSGAVTTLVENPTDWIMPFRVKAVNNIDGDNPGSDDYFTGGNHRSTNQGTGGVVTGVCDSIKFFVDGVEKTSFEGNCNEIRVEWRNRVQGHNTTKLDGTGRMILQCDYIMTIRNGKFMVRTILTPLEDIILERFYGYAMYAYNGAYVRYIGSRQNRVKTLVQTSSNSGDRKTNTISIENGSYHFDLSLDKSLDLGTGDYTDRTYDAFTSYNKTYWISVWGDNLPMSQGDNYYIDAEYRFY